MSRSMHSSTEYFGSPRVYRTNSRREVLVDVGDGEQVLEDPLEADVFAVMRGGIQLQQRLERARLDVEEMGHVHARLELSKGDLLHHILVTARGVRRRENDGRRKALRPRRSRP